MCSRPSPETVMFMIDSYSPSIKQHLTCTFACWTLDNRNNLKICNNILNSYWNQMQVLSMTSRGLLLPSKGILTLNSLHREIQGNSLWWVKPLDQFNCSLSFSFINRCAQTLCSFKPQNLYRQLTTPKQENSWTVTFLITLLWDLMNIWIMLHTKLI